MRGGPGHAARRGARRNPRLLFGQGLLRPALSLDRAQGPHPDRQPQQPAGKPPAAAQVRAGTRAGRRLVDQRPDGQSRRAHRLQRVGPARRRGLGLGPGLALLQEGRARPRLRQRVAWKKRPHPGAAHPCRALGGTRQGGRRGVQAGGHDVPARPERRVRRWLLPGHALQRQRTARVCGHRLPQRRGAQALQPHDLDQYSGEVADLRGHDLRRREGNGQRPGAGVPGQGGDPFLRRHPYAGTLDARRHRPGRPSRRDGHPRGGGPSGCRPAVDGSPVYLALLLHQAAMAASRSTRAATSIAASAIPPACRGSPRATCSWR